MPTSWRGCSNATARQPATSSSCGCGGCATCCSSSKGRAPGSFNVTWRDTLERQALALSPASLVRWLRLVTEAIETLDRNANARLALDVLMLESPTLPARA